MFLFFFFGIDIKTFSLFNRLINFYKRTFRLTFIKITIFHNLFEFSYSLLFSPFRLHFSIRQFFLFKFFSFLMKWDLYFVYINLSMSNVNIKINMLKFINIIVIIIFNITPFESLFFLHCFAIYSLLRFKDFHYHVCK